MIKTVVQRAVHRTSARVVRSRRARNVVVDSDAVARPLARLACGYAGTGHRTKPPPPMRYNLHVFSSKTTSWESKVARLACGMEAYLGDFVPTKVFSVEGGSMAWVDLWNGILLFDSVASDPEVSLIELPPLMPINSRYLRRVGFDNSLCCLDPIQDVTCSNGCFRFIEICWMPAPNS
uniref:DUF1618 domain-containing protein n=1 Tax=Oryza glumipatula TaxID=40148 RepID=A0A0D9ZLK8_9ORYZ